MDEMKNVTVVNEYDENDRKIKKKYLEQATTVVRFIRGKVDREISRRKEKVDEYRAKIENYLSDINAYGYTDEITGMPKNPTRSTTSSTEHAVLEKARLEEALRKYMDTNSVTIDGEVDENAIFEDVFEKMDREYPVFREVFCEVSDVIRSVNRVKGVLLLEDIYICGKDVKAIIIESGENKTSVYDFLNKVIDSIQIPEAQHRREWIEW